MNILLTGGAGFIGFHATKALLADLDVIWNTYEFDYLTVSVCQEHGDGPGRTELFLETERVGLVHATTERDDGVFHRSSTLKSQVSGLRSQR